MCIRDRDETATAYAISPDLWKAAAIDDVPDGGTVSFGIDMPPDRSVLTIGAALRYADGSAIIQMANIKDARQAGTMWACLLYTSPRRQSSTSLRRRRNDEQHQS